MAFLSLAQRSLDSQFVRLGEDAVWLPSGGENTSIKVMPVADDAILDGFQQMPLKTEQVLFDIRVSEAPAIAKGDSITWNSTTYRVKDAPRHPDPGRLVWRVGCARET